MDLLRLFQYKNGSTDTMDAVDQALTQVRSEIAHIQQYLSQLQETERKLVMLREARQVIAREWQGSDSRQPLSRLTSSLPPTQNVQQDTVVKGQPPLTTDIMQLLQTSDRAMTPAEIDAALRKAGRQMHPNAVTSTLSRLAKNGEVTKDEGAKYSITEDKLPLPAPVLIRPDSTVGLVYAILKEAGRPLTGMEIAAQLQAK
jgi:hypothetical protein